MDWFPIGWWIVDGMEMDLEMDSDGFRWALGHCRVDLPWETCWALAHAGPAPWAKELRDLKSLKRSMLSPWNDKISCRSNVM